MEKEKKENNQIQKNNQGKVDLYWKARNAKPKDRSVDWYWVFWIIAILFILWNIYFEGDRIFAVLVFLVAAISTYLSIKEPVVMKYGIDDDGISLENDHKKILFDEIESYNINEDEGVIYINTKKKYEMLIQIPFENNHKIDIIDATLKEKIKKDEKLKMPVFEEWLRKALGW